MNYKKYQRGYSLIELGIVLAVIGLIAGSVLITQSLLRTAETQSIISDYQRFRAAANKFITTYDGSIPGDMNDAADYWVGATNGDGDGYIDNALAAAGASSEPFEFWRHLFLADFLDTPYSGVNGTAVGVHLVPGTNIPAGKITDSGWYVGFDAQTVLGVDRMFNYPDPSNPDPSNFFLFAGATSGGVIGVPILTPNEARIIDQKIDDEVPGQGRVIGIGWDGTCSEPLSGAASSDNFETRYRASDETRQCMLVFTEAF